MKVYRNLTARRKIIDKLKHERFPSITTSVTMLTCCPRKTYYSKMGVKEYIPDEKVIMFTRGRAHHEILELYDKKEVKIQKDDVRGDIDMIDERITEIFTTTLGMKRMADVNDIKKVFSMKVSQLMAYCYMQGETEGDLLVLYLMGDYTRPIKPDIEVYTLVFTKAELDMNWQMLMGRKTVIEEGVRTSIPPLDVGEKFECNNCGYAYTCLSIEEVKL